MIINEKQVGSVAAPVRQPRPGVPALVRGLAPAPRARQLLETRGHVARVHAHPARPAHSLGAHARHLGAGEDSRVPQPGHHVSCVTCHVSCHVSPEQGGGCGEEGEDCADQDADEPLELHLLSSQRLGLEQQTR